MSNSFIRIDWQRLSRQIDDLLDLPETERATRLAAIERGAPADARLLRQWLTNIERAAAEPLAETHDEQRVGPWRAIKRLGRGGMGEVWLGERADGYYEKRVAIKFLHGDDARLRERMDSERRLLAQLQHPHIARLIDGGQTRGGQPYLVTDFVDGTSVDRWSRERQPDFARRLGVFRQVCAAASHAHGQLIVHRDIKPSNVLVDADDRAVLLDFGIARALDVADATVTTHALTLDYAAPEQVKGGLVGVRTDVYALGALWYFLLCGKPPIDLGGLPLAVGLKRICEDEPSPPSAAGLCVHVSSTLIADLDAITLKALSKSPQDRYASADRLLADVDNALTYRPLEAGRGSGRIGRAIRFVRRNRVAVCTAAAIALSLIGGSGVALWQAGKAAAQARVAQAERDRAQAEEQRIDSTLDFIVAALSSGSAGDALANAGDLVELAQTRVLANAAMGPTQRAALIDFVHDVYSRRDDWTKLKAFLLPLLNEHRHEFDDDAIADLGCKLAAVQISLGENAEARRWLDRSLALISPTTRRPDLRTFCLSVDTGWRLAVGDLAGALEQSRRLVETANPQGQRADNFTAKLLNDYGGLLVMHNQQRAAREQLLAALAIYRKAEREHSIDAVEVRVRLAAVDSHVGLLAEAVRGIDLAVDDALAASGSASNVARYLMLKAQYVLDAGHPQAALAALERSRAMIATSPAQDAAQIAPHLALHTGRAYAALGETERAEREFAQLTRLFEQAGTHAGSQYLSLARLFQAEAAIPPGVDEVRARDALKKLAATEDTNPNPNDIVHMRFYPRLRLDQAQAALYAEDFDLAGRKALEARALYAEFSVPEGWQLATCDAILAQVKLAHGDVAAGRAGLEDAIARMAISLGPDSPHVARLQAVLASAGNRAQ